MKKRILLIGNTNGLTGVKVDIENYKAFFLSPYGGYWNDSEIKVLLNPNKGDLLVELNWLKKLDLDYLIVIFSGHGGQERETVLEINNNLESINESLLKNLAKRQLNIFDCCRSFSESLVKGNLNELKLKHNLIRNTREKYEKRIIESDLGQISLYACSIGETARDTSKGGLYSSNFIECSHTSDEEYILVSEAHEKAKILTIQREPEQHPDADLLRSRNGQQLIIGINPKFK